VAENALGLEHSRVQIMPSTGVSDFELRRVLFAAARSTLAPGNPSFEEMDHWSLAIAEALLRQHSNVKGKLDPPAREGLSRSQLKRVYDYVEANLDQNISLEALGRELGMSPFHFAHGFKWRTGLSPYKYVQRQRVERGRLLLDDAGQSVCDIAHALGFSSHAHFSTAFRRELGIPPQVYRRITGGTEVPVA
jgi:transcriptional regulator GlxA family with amidase domain